jgi:DNA-binding NarL/FixJ family response regulator
MSTEMSKCVLLADRHHGMTEGVRGLLEATFDTVVMVADENSLFQAAARLEPLLAVVDISLAQRGSLAWLVRLRTLCPKLNIIVLSVHDEPNVCRSVMEAGANGFVLKRAIATDLLPAVDAVAAGEFFPPAGTSGNPPRPQGTWNSTPRE